MSVHLAHGAIPACGDCHKWLYDAGWRRAARAGRPVPRPDGTPTPCRSCPKADHGRPNPGADMTARNWAAYQLYLAVKAGAPMPDDLTAVRNCALIQLVADHLDRQRTDIPLLLSTLFRPKEN